MREYTMIYGRERVWMQSVVSVSSEAEAGIVGEENGQGEGG